MLSTRRRQSRREIIAEAREPYERLVANLVKTLQDCVTSDDEMAAMHASHDMPGSYLQVCRRINNINHAASMALMDVGRFPRDRT